MQLKEKGQWNMSSTIDNISCPDCGGNARSETDNKTGDVYLWCDDCGYENLNGELVFDYNCDYEAYDLDPYDF